MRRVLFVVAIAVGAILASTGSEPPWPVALGALLIFPIGAGVALANAAPGRPAPLVPSLAGALAGGALLALAIRLAVEAPGWLNETSADCGGPSTGAQQLVLWAGAVIFAFSALPIAGILLRLGARVSSRPGSPSPRLQAPLSAFPVAVAAAGLALIGASFVTTC